MISPRDNRRKPEPPKRRKKKGSPFSRLKAWVADKLDSLHAIISNRWLSFIGSLIFTLGILGMLALGYFGTPHSPEQLDRISLNGIHDAILAASKDPRVDGRCIAVIGGSRGGELALLLASHYPDIHAVVAIVPGSAVFPALTQAMNTPGFSLHGKPLPFVPVPWSAVPNLLVHNLRGAFDKMVANTAAMDAAAIPVERINGAVYFVSASRDEFWPSRDMSDAMMARLKRHGFAHPAEHLVVAGGHSEPLDEFPKMEAFLQSKFAGACR